MLLPHPAMALGGQILNQSYNVAVTSHFRLTFPSTTSHSTRIPTQSSALLIGITLFQVNYCNRNYSNPMPTEIIAQSYALAVGTSRGIAMGLGKLVKVPPIKLLELSVSIVQKTPLFFHVVYTLISDVNRRLRVRRWVQGGLWRLTSPCVLLAA